MHPNEYTTPLSWGAFAGILGIVIGSTLATAGLIALCGWVAT